MFNIRLIKQPCKSQAFLVHEPGMATELYVIGFLSCLTLGPTRYGDIAPLPSTMIAKTRFNGCWHRNLRNVWCVDYMFYLSLLVDVCDSTLQNSGSFNVILG